jgi:hypothetical protein
MKGALESAGSAYVVDLELRSARGMFSQDEGLQCAEIS